MEEQEMLRDRINRYFTGEITVKNENAWHYRFYKWWQEHGGKTRPGYRENLCHYMRVILFQAPFRWFFAVPYIGWTRPWMWFVSAGIVVQLWKRILGFGEDAYILTPLIFVVGLIVLAVQHGERARKILIWSMLPVWIFPAVLIDGLQGAVRVIRFDSRNWWIWFTQTCKSRFVYPCTIALAQVSLVFAGVAIYMFGVEGFLRFLVLIAAVILTTIVSFIAALVVLAAIIWFYEVVELIVRALREAKTPSRISGLGGHSRGQAESAQGSNTLQIVGQYLVTVKRRTICPYIVLPEDRKES